MKRRPNNSDGKITVQWMDDKEFSTQNFHTLGGAIEYVSTMMREATFTIDGDVLGTWTKMRGFNPARKEQGSEAPYVASRRKRA